MRIISLITGLVLISAVGITQTNSQLSLAQAEQMAGKVYQGRQQTFFCNCPYNNDILDTQSCGYRHRKNLRLGNTLAWANIVPPEQFAAKLKCWNTPDAFLQCRRRNGKTLSPQHCCRRVDRLYRAMETDLHNLVPTVAEIKTELEGFEYGAVRREPRAFGQCNFELDFKYKIAEPREAVQGDIARRFYYMRDNYGVTLTAKQQALFSMWDKQDPPDMLEVAINQRIRDIQGIGNHIIETYAAKHDIQPDNLSTNGDVIATLINALAEKAVRHDDKLAVQIRNSQPMALKTVLPWAVGIIKQDPGHRQQTLLKQMAALFAQSCAQNHAGMEIVPLKKQRFVLRNQAGGKTMDPLLITRKVVRRVLNDDDDNDALYRAYRNWLKHSGVIPSRINDARKAFAGPIKNLASALTNIGRSHFDIFSFDVKQKTTETLLFGFILNQPGYRPPSSFSLADAKADKRLHRAIKRFLKTANRKAAELDLSPDERLKIIQPGPPGPLSDYLNSLARQGIKDYYAGMFY